MANFSLVKAFATRCTFVRQYVISVQTIRRTFSFYGLGTKVERPFGMLNIFCTPGVPCISGRRYLFSSEILGLENYQRFRAERRERVGDLKGTFCAKMQEYLMASETNPIFTDDMSSMIYLAENDADLELAVNMAKRFHVQNKDLQLSTYVFGPLLLRLLFILKKPDIAYELFTDPMMSGFFNQLSSCIILMDLLYESGQHDRVLVVMDTVIQTRPSGYSHPFDCVSIASSSCYKLGTESALQTITSMITHMKTNSLSITSRCVISAAMLALKLNKPDVAMELMSSLRVDPDRRIPSVALTNLKVLIYAKLGRLDEALHLLKSLLMTDLPDYVRRGGEIFEEVLQQLQVAVTARGNKELQHKYDVINKALHDGNHVSRTSFDQYLDRPIVRQRKLSDGYRHRQRGNFGDDFKRPTGQTSYKAGLADEYRQR